MVHLIIFCAEFSTAGLIHHANGLMNIGPVMNVTGQYASLFNLGVSMPLLNFFTENQQLTSSTTKPHHSQLAVIRMFLSKCSQLLTCLSKVLHNRDGTACEFTTVSPHFCANMHNTTSHLLSNLYGA